MTIGELKLKIAGLPDDVLVLMPAGDHSYRDAGGMATTALFDKKSHMWTEDYGEDKTAVTDYGRRRKVLVII